MDREELITKAKYYKMKSEKALKVVTRKHREFLKLYPYKEHPEKIDSLTPERIYDPGKKEKDSFFYWLEYKLKNLGHLGVYGDSVWKNAKNNSEKFRKLLRTAIDAKLSISEKVDLHWEGISGFGGDKHIAKKIVYCYYPEECLPVYKTEDLELFANQLGIDYNKGTFDLFGKPYETGQKFEHLSILLLDFKDETEEIQGWNNVLFMWFLYSEFTSKKIPS